MDDRQRRQAAATATTPTTERGPRIVAAGAMAAGAACIAGTAAIHLHLHAHGYGSIPTIGALFLLQAVAGFALAAVVLVWHRWFVATAGALFLLATAGGLLYSVWFGLFGFSDSFAAPYAGLSLVLELAGAVVLGTAALLLVRVARRRGRPLWPPGIPRAHRRRATPDAPSLDATGAPGAGAPAA